MTDELSGAIAAVRSNKYSFCKFISRNDAGATGAHQAGLYIPKNALKLLFDEPGEIGANKEKYASLKWQDGINVNCRFIYYGKGTRNEYRITRLGRNFVEGQFVVIIKENEDNYLGFLINNKLDIANFMSAFNLLEDDTNKLIPTNKSATLEITARHEEQTILNFSNDADVLMANHVNFKPKAHILILLGEELIKSPVMAIYELIKNGYDADAKEIEVSFENIENIGDTKITIKDSGTGITAEVLENVWFEPGSDFRKPINSDGKRVIKRSPIYKRIPMGEKGVGRFAVHKLGNKIKLVSRPCILKLDDNTNVISSELLDYEVSVDIDWRKFSQSKYLEDVSIEWYKNSDPQTFVFKNTHGTLIEIEGLKEEWTRGMARQLKRQTLSMLSPKNNAENFKIDLNFGNWWLNDIPDTSNLLKEAPYTLKVTVDAEYNMTFEYKFNLIYNKELGSRVIDNDSTSFLDKPKYKSNIKSSLKPFYRDYLVDREYESYVIEEILAEFDQATLPFGDFSMEVYSFDLDSDSLRDVTTNARLLKSLLKEHSGVKVFKGDLRVYDYGDPGNDWLGFDLKRVNNKEWFSNNQVIGYIYLDPQNSGPLVEKTNREGFIHNAAYENFVVLLDYIFHQFKSERQSDRDRWLKYNRKGIGYNSFESQVSNFKNLITSTELGDKIKGQLLDEADKIEERYVEDKNNLLIPAGVGMTASFAMHEIEKLVPRMQETVKDDLIDKLRITHQIEELKDYVEGILSVLKKGGNKAISLKEAIDQALYNYDSRLRGRNILIETKFDESIESVVCDKRLLVTVIMNLIDNSMYWLDTIFSPSKNIYISTSKVENGISILIVDNGPGFKEGPQDIVRPFYTRKQNGIGIGMYLVDTIMIQYGKLKINYDHTYLSNRGVPEIYTGAAVELIFNKLQS